MQKLLLPLAIAAFFIPSAYSQTVASPERAASATGYARLVEPPGELSLSAALDLAYRANPDIAVARREVQAIEGVILQAQTRCFR